MRCSILPHALLGAALLVIGCEQATLVSPEPVPEARIAPQAQTALTAEAGGDFIVEDAIPTSVAPDGDECQIELMATFRFEGSLQGSFTAPFEIEHEGPCDEPAPEEFEAQGTFAGTVNGASGTFEVKFEGTISTAGQAQGVLEIEEGTGELEGLEGSLTLTGIAGVSGTYTGFLRFEDD